MNGRTAGTLGTAALLMAGGTWMALNRSYSTLPEALAAQGYTWAATITTSTGPVDFAATIDYPFGAKFPQQHFDRYKVWAACAHGTPCSLGGCGAEALWGNWWAVEAVIQHPSNPLNLVNNQVYRATPQDQLDVERLTLRGGNCQSGAFRGYFLPTARALGILDPPEPTVTPPPPTPTPTPAPSGPLTSREFPCPGGMERSTAQLCIEVYEP